MTDDMMALRGLLEKSSDADLLREMIGFTAQRLMALEVEGLTGARISSAWASIRCERWSPPCGLGPTSPVRRHRFTHLIAVEAATPKRRAAERRDRPLSTADTSRSRRSLERGFVMQAGLLHQPTS